MQELASARMFSCARETGGYLLRCRNSGGWCEMCKQTRSLVRPGQAVHRVSAGSGTGLSGPYPEIPVLDRKIRHQTVKDKRDAAVLRHHGYAAGEGSETQRMVRDARCRLAVDLHRARAEQLEILQRDMGD